MNCVVVMGIHMKNTQLADRHYDIQLSEQQANESVCRLDHVTNTVHYSPTVIHGSIFTAMICVIGV
jgi:hypothetical protein